MGSALRLILPIEVSTDYLRDPNKVGTSQPLGRLKWGRRVTDGLVEARTPPARLFDQSSPSMNSVRLLLWRMVRCYCEEEKRRSHPLAQDGPYVTESMLKRMATPSTNDVSLGAGENSLTLWRLIWQWVD